MDTEIGSLEERLKSFLEQLNTECGIFERIVYKNKNQHRRSSYFQYLLKVRRDLRLLQSAKLDEILACCFHVFTGKKPKQKLHLLESLKWRKCDCGVPNFMERLLGAARLLSQMVEPMLKAATEISILLAQSFFMGFSLTILASLARLRVLVQQILLDFVSAFNMVSSLSQKKQSVKITQEGIEVFRDFYPTNKFFVTLECTWETDKFLLVERTHERSLTNQVGDVADASIKTSAVQYKSVESFLGDDSDMEDNTAKEGSSHNQEDSKHLSISPSSKSENKTQGYGGIELGDNPVKVGSKDERPHPEGEPQATSGTSPSSIFLSQKSGGKSVAFVSVKRPAPSTSAFVAVKKPATSTANASDRCPSEEVVKDNSSKEDSFFNLLTGGSIKDVALLFHIILQLDH
ncbi:uncharacterized protein [Euphorbia lathyris]|uniref:uncharacterized protein isoform X2 n=1 Tax=Euphorbia lathyris TaxID=212925 RepID=UPI003313B30F